MSEINLFSKAKVHYQLPVNKLVEQALQRKDGVLNDTGALVIATGEFTGRSPADKFIVKDEHTAEIVNWNKFNNPIDESYFMLLMNDLLVYLDEQSDVWIRDAYACADPAYRLSLRVINENPWSNHFAANMFIKPSEGDLDDFIPEWLIIQAPGFKADPLIHGTRKGNFTVVSFTHRTILIGGSGYTGEIKKGIFTVLNYILPLKHRVLSMHCSANEGADGDTALFFGLSGTGKTTLSSDPSRKLIGDDEHGWDDKGIFNFEGGCYAKIINLSAQQEPQIFDAIRSGALVENTRFINGTNKIDFECKVITENTRVSYPLNYIKNSKIPSISGLPKNLFFLTCDAYGVLPPISKLTHEQAMFYFISGFTAKVAGTEEGVSEPQTTFSPCFGAPFLPLHPAFYAELLKEKLESHKTTVWMINTGWTGGAYGVGNRIKLDYTRAMITAVLNGELDNTVYEPHAVFGMLIPQSCPGVPSEILNPCMTWPDKKAYHKTAIELTKKFNDNFKQYSNQPQSVISYDVVQEVR
jgi:phosphoenolpyruvate carboxykinase (ATP)